MHHVSSLCGARLRGWLFCLLVCAPVFAQQPGEALCGRCGTTGKQEFDVDRALAVEHEHGEQWEVLFCSEAIESKNMGLDWIVCPHCRTASLQELAQTEWDAIAETNRVWLEERRRMERLAEFDEVVYLETTHFILSWNLSKMKVDRKTLRMHESAHLFARRFEEFYAEFQAITRVVDEDNMRNKHFVFAFEEGAQALAVGPTYAGLSHSGTVKRTGGADKDSVIVTWRQKSEHPSEGDFHRHLIHNLTHQLTSVYRNTSWFTPGQFGLAPPWLNDDYGWFDAGLAHWFERRVDGRSETYCFREQDVGSRWGGGDWHRNVWKAVMAEEWPSFALLLNKPTQSLTAREHQFCWSWVDFLLSRNAEGTAQAIKLAKMETPTREILREVYRLSMLSFEEDWAEWVKQAYAPSNKDPGFDPRRDDDQGAPQRR